MYVNFTLSYPIAIGKAVLMLSLKVAKSSNEMVKTGKLHVTNVRSSTCVEKEMHI